MSPKDLTIDFSTDKEYGYLTGHFATHWSVSLAQRYWRSQSCRSEDIGIDNNEISAERALRATPGGTVSFATIGTVLGDNSSISWNKWKPNFTPTRPQPKQTVVSGRTSRQWNAAMIQFPKVRCGMKIVRANIHNLIDSSMIKQNDY